MAQRLGALDLKTPPLTIGPRPGPVSGLSIQARRRFWYCSITATLYCNHSALDPHGRLRDAYINNHYDSQGVPFDY